MEEKIISELQKLYSNDKVGALVQEICEYYASRGDYESGSYEDEIEPPEIVEPVYILFCLQSRERILDEFQIVRKRYPALYSCVSALCDRLLVNMDYAALEKECAQVIASYAGNLSSEDVLGSVERCCRSSENLSAALDKFYSYLHSQRR